MSRHLSIVAAACLLLAQAGTSAFAQQPPSAAPVASTRCGGLLCDMYYAGKPAPAPGQPDVPSPTSLPCRDFLCAAFGGRTPEAAQPVAEAAAAPAPEPVKAAKHKRKARKADASAEATPDAAK